MLGLVGAFVVVPPASALQHFMVVQEAYPGSAINPSSEFVELQMYTANQNFVAGHPVRFYSATGAQTASATFAGSVPNGQNQRSILIATPEAVTQFGVAADLSIGAGLDPSGGAACWSTFDCVSWGNFTGSAALPSATGTPEAAIPDGSSLCRSIAAGNPTLLESGDDTDNSANDFLPTPPAPRNNAGPAAGEPCPGDTGGGGGGGGGADITPPNTKITHHPHKRSDDAIAKFTFKSTEAGSSFKCKLDRKPFRRCKSPKKYKRLDRGEHKFQVVATDGAGNKDRTPAKFTFKVVG